MHFKGFRKLKISSWMVIVLCGLCLSIACRDNKKFSGSSESRKVPEAPAETPPDDGGEPVTPPPSEPENPPPTPGPNECSLADKIDVAFPKDVQSCFDAGKIWDFHKKACVEVDKPKFECNFAGLIKAITDLGMQPPEALNNAKSTDGSQVKLTACASRHQGDTIIAQWVYLPKEQSDSCVYDAKHGQPYTGCFRLMNNPPDLSGASQEELREFISECLVAPKEN